MIIPSKHVLLISAVQRKQVFLFDPKTACVLYTYSSQSGMGSNAAYYQQGQQFIIPHLNNSFVNVWDTDAQQPRKFSVGENDKMTCLSMIEGNILYMGSSQGILYIFQLPSGILIRKAQLHAHSSQIRRILYLEQMGYFITCTPKQIKLWPIRQVISQNQKPIAQKTIHSVTQIIAIELIRGILCVVTERTLQFYFAANFYSFTLSRDIPALNNITCSCSSSGSLFLGDAMGKIRQIPIDGHQKQLKFQQRKGKILLENKKGLQIQTKQPISILAFIQSLQFLVAGNSKGQIKIWSGQTLKNSVQLFKSPICLLSVIGRPNKQQKITQNLKIRSFHKQPMTKLQQPIVVDSGIIQVGKKQQKVYTQDEYLQKMMNFLNDPSEQVQNEIQSIRRQNRDLLQANLEYCRFLSEEKQMKKQEKQYK